MNSLASSLPVRLGSHPRTPSQAIDAIDVLVGVAPGDALGLVFILECNLAGLRIPAPRPSRRADGLWRHTCFEVFAMAENRPGYRELNLSPSGEWGLYDFRGYRDGVKLETELAPEIAVRRTPHGLELDAQISRELLPQGQPLRLGLSAVLEDTDGVLSYWALRHPPGRPDFHHPDSFAMQLDLP
jgi:hypothetical protein